MKELVFNHRRILEEMSGLFEREKDCAAAVYINPDVVKARTETLEAAQRESGEAFRVLIIGPYSSGKTSLANALIGEKLLPTDLEPQTALIAELCYGSEKKVTIYPWPGSGEDGDRPFELPEASTSKIWEYVSHNEHAALSGTEENPVGSKLEKMVIHWPLNMLKDGIILVVSPVLDNPAARDEIMRDNLPQADAVIYVMNVNTPYSDLDIQQLKSINALGLRNIITCFTQYDILKNKSPTAKALEQARSALIAQAEDYSTLGRSSVHFLDSLAGYQSKTIGAPEPQKQELYISSGYAEFERYLARYLVEGKGRDQLRNSAISLLQQADSMSDDIRSIDNAVKAKQQELTELTGGAEQKLQILRRNAHDTWRLYDLHLTDCLPEFQRMTEEFIDGFAEQVDLEGFEPEIKASPALLLMGAPGAAIMYKKANAIQKECQEELIARMNAVITTWIQETLAERVFNTIRERTNEIHDSVLWISESLDSISAELSGKAASPAGSVTSNSLRVCNAIASGEWFAQAVFQMHGTGVYVKSLRAAPDWHVMLSMIVFVPAELPLIAAINMGRNIGNMLIKGGNAKKFKNEAVKALRRALKKGSKEPSTVAYKEELVSKIINGLSDCIEFARQDMKKAFDADLDAVENTIRQIDEFSRLGGEERERRTVERAKAEQELSEIRSRVKEICAQYNIRDIAGED